MGKIVYEYDIKVTLKIGEYKGNFILRICDNIQPLTAIKYAISSLNKKHFQSIKIIKNNCHYKKYQDNNGIYLFKAVLKNANKQQYTIISKYDSLQKYITGFNIIHYHIKEIKGG